MTIDQLNERFGKNESIVFVTGEGNLPKVHLRSSGGGSCELYLYGGHVTSWRTPDGIERLFLSKKAVYGGGKAIRGGIPLIFPQFGPGTLPSHGFARNTPWEVIESTASSQTTSLSIRLSATPDLMKIWGYHFESTLTVTVSDTLELRWMTINTGRIPVTFQKALHTYFPVSRIGSARVLGLSNLDFLDNAKGKARGHDDRDAATINEEVDRVYINAPDLMTIVDDSDGSRIEIEKRGLRDAVLWNPWVEKSKSLSDLAPDDYQRFLCLESGAINTPITLAAGDGGEVSQTLRYRR
jgi:glucose-6-phosphate 1-epimerase